MCIFIFICLAENNLNALLSITNNANEILYDLCE